MQQGFASYGEQDGLRSLSRVLSSAAGAIGLRLVGTYRRPLYYGSTPAATRPLLAAVGREMSQPVSHNKPPGKPTTIMHKPTSKEAARAASAGIPNPARTTTK